MPGKWNTLRTFKTPNFTVALAATVDEDAFTYDGEDEDGSIQEQIDNGTLVPWLFRVRVCLGENELASDYLGASYYDDPHAFMNHKDVGRTNREWAAEGKTSRCGSYFSDMVKTAIADARKELKKLQTVYVR